MPEANQPEPELFAAVIDPALLQAGIDPVRQPERVARLLDFVPGSFWEIAAKRAGIDKPKQETKSAVIRHYLGFRHAGDGFVRDVV